MVNPKIFDLSRVLEMGMPQPMSLPRFAIWNCASQDWEDQINCNAMLLAEHVGSNCDAPYHVLKDGKKMDELPVDAFIGPGIVLNFLGIEDNSIINAEDIKRAVRQQNLQIEKGQIILFYTGFDDKHWDTSPSISKKLKDRPTISEDAANYLVNKEIKAIGLDTGSPDITGTCLPIHHILLNANVLIIESLCNLGQLPDKNFLFIALPLNIKGGSGSPVRACGLVFE
jgi:kynurenine formamidase